MIKLIWAMDKNWLIGINNKLPWRYKEDLAYFKEQTHGKTVLMGLNTYKSLKFTYYKGGKLPFNKIYVASKDNKIKYNDVIMVNDIDKFLSVYKGELWVIGGATIYSLSLKHADELYITWINKEYNGDAYFPKFNLDEDFKVIKERQGKTEELMFSLYGRVKK